MIAFLWTPWGLVSLAAVVATLERPDIGWWATTLQLVGAVVAFLGFSSAYVRAAYGLSLPQWLWQRWKKLKASVETELLGRRRGRHLFAGAHLEVTVDGGNRCRCRASPSHS